MNNNPFVNFCKKYEIDRIEMSEVGGWNHSRPSIGFFSGSNEIANIHDSELHYLSDGLNCINENGDNVDWDDENSQHTYETHCPCMTGSKSSYCSLYATEEEYEKERIKKIDEDCAEINNWLMENEICVDVDFKKNGEEIEWSDGYKQFTEGVYNLIKDELKDAMEA